jgi:hypothetical protein
MSGEKSSRHSNGSKGSNGFAKLDFPRYSRDDPRVWLDWVVQYFDYKQMLEEQRVSLAAFHLEKRGQSMVAIDEEGVQGEPAAHYMGSI